MVADGGAATPAAPSGGEVTMGAVPLTLAAEAPAPLGVEVGGDHALVASEPALAGGPATGDADEPALAAAEGVDAERSGWSFAQAAQIAKTRLGMT